MIVLLGPSPSPHTVARALTAHQAVVILTPGVPHDAQHTHHELQAMLAERRPRRASA